MIKMVCSGNNYNLVKVGSYHWIIFSYNTPVLEIVYNKGETALRRGWEGYSKTTMKHIRYCLHFLGLSPISKKEWDEMEVESL